MIAIIAALKPEMSDLIEFLKIHERIYYNSGIILKGKLHSQDLMIARSGVGNQNAYQMARYIIDQFKPTTLLSIGFGGGATPLLHVGDIALATRVIDQATKEFWETSATLTSELESAASTAAIEIQQGVVISVNHPINDPHQKAFLGTEFDAISIDMESTGIAKAATETNTPFTVARTIFDTVEVPLPQFETEMSDGGEISPTKIVTHFLTHPKDILKIPQFKYASEQCKQNLKQLIHTWLTKKLIH